MSLLERNMSSFNYVLVDSDDEPRDKEPSSKVQSSNKHVEPAKPWVVPSDGTYDGYGDALFGNYQEFTRPMHCHITGTVPSWLYGSFIRMGNARYNWGETEAKHMFDGDAISHKFSIKDGQVMYQSKFVQSEYHRKNEKYNRISCSGFATWAPPDPCANIFQRFAAYFYPSMDLDNTNVNIFEIQGKHYAATEVPWMCEIDPKTLDTIKIINARNKMNASTGTWLAHPHFDRDGTTWICNTKYGMKMEYQIIRIPKDPGPDDLSGISVVKSIECGDLGPGYYHSFAFSDNYVILVENPMVMDGMCKLLTMNICHRTFADCLIWKPEYGSRFRIVSKKTGEELRMCRAEAFFVFHHVNAYEKDGELIVDLCAHPDDSAIRLYMLDTCRDSFKGKTVKPPNLRRYRIPLKELYKNDPEPYNFPNVPGEDGDFETLAADIEAPVINYDMTNGRDYTYMWGMNDFVLKQKMVKVNVKTKDVLYWTPPHNEIPSLPFFIPRPGAKEEDDGVCITTCTGANGVESYFLVLDAKTMKEVARANMPVGIPFGFHGNFFPSV